MATKTDVDTTPNAKLEEHRIAMFEELGFTKAEAAKLHGSVFNERIAGKDYAMRLSHHDVKKHLDQGATLNQIVRIFT